jgi:hypothetical protein
MKRIELSSDNEAWIGPRYGENGVRLLVVGESAHSPDEQHQWDDWDNVHAYVSGTKRPTRVFTRQAQAVLPEMMVGDLKAKGLLLKATRLLWESWAYYNYMVAWVPAKPREPVPDAARKTLENRDMFMRVVRESEATHIVVWGKQNWPTTPASEWGTVLPNTHLIDGHSVRATWIFHPASSACTNAHLRERMAALLEKPWEPLF